MDWIAVALDRDRWRAVVNAVMGRRFPYNASNFRLTDDRLPSQKRL